MKVFKIRNNTITISIILFRCSLNNRHSCLLYRFLLYLMAQVSITWSKKLAPQKCHLFCFLKFDCTLLNQPQKYFLIKLMIFERNELQITFFQTDLSTRKTQHLFRRSTSTRSRHFLQDFQKLETDRKRNSSRQSRSSACRTSSRLASCESRLMRGFERVQRGILRSQNILEERTIWHSRSWQFETELGMRWVRYCKLVAWLQILLL